MLAVHEGDVPLASTFVDEGHASLHEQRLSLRAASRALEEIAEREAQEEEAVPHR